MGWHCKHVLSFAVGCCAGCVGRQLVVCSVAVGTAGQPVWHQQLRMALCVAHRALTMTVFRFPWFLLSAGVQARRLLWAACGGVLLSLLVRVAWVGGMGVGLQHDGVTLIGWQCSCCSAAGATVAVASEVTAWFHPQPVAPVA